MTSAPGTLQALQANLTAHLGTTNLGIVGDAAHVATGGYHIGAASLRANGMSGDYSLHYPADQVTHDYACAVDIGGTPDLLMTLGNRIVNALVSHDPRVYGRIRGVNSPWGGQGIDRRYDSAEGGEVESSDDRNHIHIEVYRTLVLEQATMDGLFSVLSEGGVAPAPPAPPAPAQGNPIHGMAVPALIRQGSGQYLGSYSGPAASHGGYNASEQGIVMLWQKFLIWNGDVPGQSNINSGWADGIYDNKTDKPNTGPTSTATSEFQKKYLASTTTLWGQCWWDDWTKAASL